MSQAQVRVWAPATGGPFAYQVDIDGVTTNVATGIATLVLVLDAVKPILGAMPGTPKLITLSMTTI